MITRLSALILWSTPVGMWAQVNLPRGFEVVEIAVDDRFTGRPSINNCGQIVYSKEENQPPYGPELYLYDNGSIIQITHNDIPDDFPVINDQGDIAWKRYVPETDTVQLVFLRDGFETVVDEAWSLGSPAINNLGHLAWSHYFEGNCNWNLRVMFWDGGTVAQITPAEEYYNQQVNLNDFDEIVWAHMDVCGSPWTGRIQAYWDGQIVDLPPVTTQDQAPDINNDRHVVWSAGQDSVLWRDGDVVTITSHGAVPKLNERDEIYAPVWEEDRGVWQPWLFHVRNNRIRSYRLADRDRWYTDGSINDSGETACRWRIRPDGDRGILYLRRTRSGDSEFDGRIDLRDHQRMTKCMTGPGRVDGLCECRFLDIDHDGDVDLADYSAFQNAFHPD